MCYKLRLQAFNPSNYDLRCTYHSFNAFRPTFGIIEAPSSEITVGSAYIKSISPFVTFFNAEKKVHGQTTDQPTNQYLKS